MGWFNKKTGEKKGTQLDVPELPELPRLPELPNFEEESLKQPPTKGREPNPLPSFSTRSLDKRFSKNAIKDAVSGEKEDDVRFANDLGKVPMMHSPHREKLTRELDEEGWNLQNEHHIIPEEFHEAAQKVREAEPVFIRIDKFQNSLDLFEKIKREVHEIEQKLGNIKNIQDEEEKELDQWQKEIIEIKDQISQIDKDVFSKVD